MSWKIESKGTNVVDLMQVMRDGVKEQENPTDVPTSLADIVGRLLEVLSTSTGNAPLGKQWEVACDGDKEKGTLTISVKTSDAPKPPKDPAEQKPAPASEGPTATPAPAPKDPTGPTPHTTTPTHKGK